MDRADKDLLFTARWLVSNKLGESKTRDDILDILTEVLDVDQPSHVDRDMLPVPGARLTKEEREITKRKIDLIQTSGKVAIVIGHNCNTGAQSFDGDDEWETRKIVAEALQDELAKRGIDSRIFIRDRALSYGDAMRKHGREIDKFEADVAIELHFNSAANPAAHGTEFIVCSSSGVKVVRHIALYWNKHFPSMTLRHDKGVLMRKHGRGSGFCRAPKCPALVYEPCFASNTREWPYFENNPHLEAVALADGLASYLKSKC